MQETYTRPSHYEKISDLGKPILEKLGIEIKENCFDTIHSLEKLGLFHFDALNAIKYLWRLGKKGSKKDWLLDLQKACDYLESEALLVYNVDRGELKWTTYDGGINSSFAMERISEAWMACQYLFNKLSAEIKPIDWFAELEIQRNSHQELFGRSPVYSPLEDSLSAIQLIDLMGRDLSVANDARSSFNRQSLELDRKDEKLIDYLANADPKHSSPFRGCVLKFKIAAPLSTARQWWKHSIASCHAEDQHQWNEQSFRFTELAEPSFYLPRNFRTQATDNRQCSAGNLSEEVDKRIREIAFAAHSSAYETYKTMLALGVAREQARDHLPIGTYTTWIWTVSLQALLHFLELRKGTGAQTEIKAYADTIEEILRQIFPVATNAWLD